ncbi:hypothetical protein GS501_04540 [Saccharibacter sp. 17.LH.SD]|uniref:hypothetical protein n=1 Tax=Saccharibacter sp. 17.LH.SD TaxID=2689393 RepID=UPI001370A7D0|nr:hypothetical protein [Saccharibacter sp. 17.LH.SD]MXV44313.1 hypothetical protein [Saccharibacter sp. 17.LH.SD]
MTDLFRKIPQSPSLSRSSKAVTRRVADRTPRTFPASIVSIEGRIVTVQIEANSDIPLPLLTIPLMESEYVRTPLQPGCKGVIIGTHASTAFLAGLDSRRPDINDRKNTLTGCVFIPISEKDWAQLDGKRLNLYGIDGVEITDRLKGSTRVELTKDKATISQGEMTKAVLSGDSITLTQRLTKAVLSQNTVTLTTGGATITLAGDNVNIVGKLTINGKAYKDHTHTNGNQGSPTGGVIE